MFKFRSERTAMSTQLFSERLLGRRITRPEEGVIEMIYMGDDRSVTVNVPILVVRLDKTGELASFYVNKVHVVEG
jgi:hypothetical protein